MGPSIFEALQWLDVMKQKTFLIDEAEIFLARLQQRRMNYLEDRVVLAGAKWFT